MLRALDFIHALLICSIVLGKYAHTSAPTSQWPPPVIQQTGLYSSTSSSATIEGEPEMATTYWTNQDQSRRDDISATTTTTTTSGQLGVEPNDMQPTDIEYLARKLPDHWTDGDADTDTTKEPQQQIMRLARPQGTRRLGAAPDNLSSSVRPPAPITTQLPPGFLTQPPDTSARVNGTLLLRCELTAPSRCSWRRGGIPILEGGRYQYLTPSDSQGRRTDCTLRIAPVSMLDAGPWECSNGAALWSTTGNVQVTEAPPPPVVLTRHPDNATALLDSPVQLHCTFNASVNCTWQRDAHTVLVGNRYVYVAATGGVGGNNTSDCSLRIPHVQAVDAGRWRCARLTTPASLTQWSREAHLQVQVPWAPGAPVISMSHLPLSDPSGNLACTAPASFPPARLHWQLDALRLEGVQVEVSAGRGPGDVPLSSTRLTWNATGGWGPFTGARTLSCWVTHPALEVPQQARIGVVYAAVAPSLPEIIRDGRPVSEVSLYSFGDALGTLECVSRSGNPAAQLVWELDGRRPPAPAAPNVTADGDSLFSVRLSWPSPVGDGAPTVDQFNASKVLRCVGRHPSWERAGGPRHATLYFTRNFAATDVQILWRMAPTESDVPPSVLHCSARGFPPPDYSWEYRVNDSVAWQKSAIGPEVTVGQRGGHFRCTARNALSDYGGAPAATKEVSVHGQELVVISMGYTIGYVVLASYSLLMTILVIVAAILHRKRKWPYRTSNTSAPEVGRQRIRTDHARIPDSDSNQAMAMLLLGRRQ